MKVLTVIGARPQFVKCAVVSRALRTRHTEFLVHTGQHYDYGMSEVFFEQLGIPEPDLNLGVGSGPHGQMTGRMLETIEQVLLQQRPDWMLVYGDTNSTLAGALAASKLHIPVAHVEAGLRSFNRLMPEELNRIVADHLSTLLLCPTPNAVALLAREGVTKNVHDVGDVMFDSVLLQRDRARSTLDLDEMVTAFGLKAGASYAIATLHRPENTDDPARLSSIIEGLSGVGIPVVLPLHPRTRKVLKDDPVLSKRIGASIVIVEPLGYLELLRVAEGAAVILTDSGGLQKEAFFLGVRCVTMRDQTEWIETVEADANAIVGADTAKIIAEAKRAIARGRLVDVSAKSPFGDGHAASRIVERLESCER